MKWKEKEKELESTVFNSDKKALEILYKGLLGFEIIIDNEFLK